MIDNDCPTIKIGIGIMMETSDMISKQHQQCITNSSFSPTRIVGEGAESIMVSSKQNKQENRAKAKWYQSSR